MEHITPRTKTSLQTPWQVPEYGGYFVQEIPKHGFRGNSQTFVHQGGDCNVKFTPSGLLAACWSSVGPHRCIWGWCPAPIPKLPASTSQGLCNSRKPRAVVIAGKRCLGSSYSWECGPQRPYGLRLTRMEQFRNSSLKEKSLTVIHTKTMQELKGIHLCLWLQCEAAFQESYSIQWWLT